MLHADISALLLAAAQEPAATEAASSGGGVIYGLFVLLHSLLRWVVLGVGIAALVKAAKGGAWGPQNRALNAAFMGSVHANVVIGLVLYAALSPTTASAFADMGGAMKNPVLRFYAVEHITLMILAAVFATVGSVRAKKAADDAKKHKAALIFFGITMALLLLGIPWWFREAGRPLFWLPF